MKRWIPVKNYQDQNRVKENIETAFMDLWQWPVGLWPWSILSRIAITSPFKVTVWAAHQFFQLILLSVWPRGPHFTVHSHTVFLPLMHRLFWQLGDNQSWNRKGRKAIRDALAVLALRSQKSRTQRMLKHKKKKCDHDMPRKHWLRHSDCAWYPKDAQCPTVPICIPSLLQFT